MATRDACTDETGVDGLDAAVALRCATLAVGVAATLWHAVGLVGLGGPVLLAGLLFVFALAGWTAWLGARPSRRCLGVGAVVTALALMSSGLLLADAPAIGLPQVVGLLLKGTLLSLTLTALARAPSRRIVRLVARGGLTSAAVTLSVVVAGGSHAHAAPSAAEPGSTPTTRELLCRLV